MYYDYAIYNLAANHKTYYRSCNILGISLAYYKIEIQPIQ